MISQVLVKRLAVCRGLNLAGVGIADGGDTVGIGDAALEHIRVLIALLHCHDIKHIVGQTGPVFYRRDIVNALEAEVMYREYCPRAADGSIVEHPAKIHGYKSRLPVMAVNDIRYPVHVIKRSKRSLAEEAILGNVVHKVGIGIPVGEEILIVYKIIGHAVIHILHYADVKISSGAAKIHIKLAAVNHLVLIFLRDALIARENYSHIAVHLCKRTRQGVHNVAKSARLNKRMAL